MFQFTCLMTRKEDRGVYVLVSNGRLTSGQLVTSGVYYSWTVEANWIFHTWSERKGRWIQGLFVSSDSSGGSLVQK